MVPMNHTKHSHNNSKGFYSNVRRIIMLTNTLMDRPTLQLNKMIKGAMKSKIQAQILAILKHKPSLLTTCFLGFNYTTRQEDHSSKATTMTH